MKDILNLAQAVAAAHTTGQLTDGRLLSPTEYHGTSAIGNGDTPEKSTPWVLQGAITPRWLSRLPLSLAAAAERQIEVSVTEGEEHLAFLLVVQHLQAFEHRLVLPLLGKSVSAFLRAALEVPPLLVLGTERHTASSIRLEVRAGLWREALALTQPNINTPVNALNQLMRFSMQMLAGERIGSVQPGVPKKMVVSPVPPPEAEAWLEQQLGQIGHGPAPH